MRLATRRREKPSRVARPSPHESITSQSRPKRVVSVCFGTVEHQLIAPPGQPRPHCARTLVRQRPRSGARGTDGVDPTHHFGARVGGARPVGARHAARVHRGAGRHRGGHRDLRRAQGHPLRRTTLGCVRIAYTSTTPSRDERRPTRPETASTQREHPRTQSGVHLCPKFKFHQRLSGSCNTSVTTSMAVTTTMPIATPSPHRFVVISTTYCRSPASFSGSEQSGGSSWPASCSPLMPAYRLRRPGDRHETGRRPHLTRLPAELRGAVVEDSPSIRSAGSSHRIPWSEFPLAG